MAENLLPENILDRPLRQFPNLWSNFFPFHMENYDTDLSFLDFSKGTKIYEENNELHVEVPLPGLNQNDIEVSLNKGLLTIKGQAAEEEKDKKRKYYRSSKRSYAYTLALPTQIDEKQEPEAIYSDGILKISLQLGKQAGAKKIKVKSKK